MRHGGDVEGGMRSDSGLAGDGVGCREGRLVKVLASSLSW